MSAPAQQSMRSWMEQELSIDGVLAAGGGVGGQSFSAFASGELVLAHNEEIWRRIAEAIARLHAQGAPIGELLWGFEHALLCTIQRDDGAWLGVFTVPHLGDESALALRIKLDAFRQQQFGNGNEK